MKKVELDEKHVYRFPHEFSGGQQRRLELARILILNPSLIVFDEPTSGLDVSVQATILNFFKEIKRKYNLTYIFISHDLEIIRMMTERVAVMYLGKIVENGNTGLIFRSPKHPYTKILLSAIPKIRTGHDEVLKIMIGEPPNPQNLSKGCCFRSRCPIATDLCQEEEPQVRKMGDGRDIACNVI